MRAELMTKPTAKLLHKALEPFPLMRSCFMQYVDWFVENVTDDWESYDLIDALRKDESDKLSKTEKLLSNAREILGLSEREFTNTFGFTDDLLTKDPDKIHDVLAEPLFVVDLNRNGFSEIRKLPQFIKSCSKKIPNSDFLAVRSDRKFAIELKTIRMEAKPKPIPGKLLGDSTKPSWWSEMFWNNAVTKIEDKNRRALRQLENAAREYQCQKKMLVLYTRRLGPSTLMTRDEYSEQLARILRKYTILDYVVSKDYFGEVVFYPMLKINEVQLS